MKGVINMTNYDLFGKPVIEKTDLKDEFIIPPFSILDTASGDWQNRKNRWKALGIESEVGRDNPSAIRLSETGNDITKTPYVSIFDPVLCELMYRWFVPKNGDILDPFAGGSVRGIVSNYLGYYYTGLELREEQVDANIQQGIDIVDENMEIDISKEGIVTVYDKITNTVEKYGGPLSDSTLVTQSDDFSIQPTDLSSKQIDEEKMNISTSEKIIPKLREISTRASDIFGTGNKFKDITAGLAGVTPKFFDKYLIDPDVVQAKKDYGLIKKELELSLTNNPRFPVAEVNRILDLLPNEKSFIQDPQSGAIALNTIANEIQQKLDESKSLLSGSKITTDIMQGSGVQISPFEPKTQEDLGKIKSGQYFIYNGEIRIMK